MKIRVAPIVVALGLAAHAAFGGAITGVTVTRVTNGPQAIAGETTGPDGNVWFVAWKDNAIGRVSTDGSIRMFPLPTPNASADQITTGGDGNLWFTEQVGNIGKITPQGVITEFPAGAPVSGPIVSGSDGAVWFMQTTLGLHSTTKLGRITGDGTVTTYDLASADTFVTMATGPDGRLWLYDSTKNSVVTFSTKKGTVAATYPIPTPAGQFIGFINHFVVASDGNMWLTHNNSLVRIQPDGTMTDYPVPTANANPSGLVDGGDGSLWFSEYSGRKLGQLVLSTATDNGQATINESDAVLANGSLDLTLLTGPTPATDPNASTKIDPDAVNFAPCLFHYVYSWHTVDGEWVQVTWENPPHRCADISVSGSILSTSPANDRTGLLLGKTRIDCLVANNGPSTATNVTMLCNAVNASIVTNNLPVGKNCTITPSNKGVILHANVLVKGSICTFDADLAVVDDDDFGVTIDAYANEVDPDPRNNFISNSYSFKDGEIHSKEKKTPAVLKARGH